MKRSLSLQKWHGFGMGRGFVLGTLIILGAVISTVAISSNTSAHDGDASLVHACVNQTNAQVRIAHPGPGDENTDCTALGADWLNVHLDEDWTGAGTGSLVARG